MDRESANNVTTTTTTKVSIFDIVPMDLLLNHILGQYCTGKTISTFAIVFEGYYHYNNYSYNNSSNCSINRSIEDDDYYDQKPSATSNNNTNKRKRTNDTTGSITTNITIPTGATVTKTTTTTTFETTETTTNHRSDTTGTTVRTATRHPNNNHNHFDSINILRKPLLTRYEILSTLIRQRRMKYSKRSSSTTDSSYNNNNIINNNIMKNDTTTNDDADDDNNYDETSTTKNNNNNHNKNDDGYVYCEVEKVLEYIQCMIRTTKLQVRNNNPHNESSSDSATNNNNNINNNKMSFIFDQCKERIQLISKWCAILDYFELIPIDDTLPTTTKNSWLYEEDIEYCTSSLIIWVGKMETRWGDVDDAIITCSTTSPIKTTLYNTDYMFNEPYSTWTVAAFGYWYSIFDTSKHLFDEDTFDPAYWSENEIVPYGTLSTMEDHLLGGGKTDTTTTGDKEKKDYFTDDTKTSLDYVIENHHNNKEENDSCSSSNDESSDGVLGGSIILLPMDYRMWGYDHMHIHVLPPDPPNYHTKGELYWDPELYDDNNITWEDTLMKDFPFHVIRIMNRLQHLNPNPYQHTYDSYRTY